MDALLDGELEKLDFVFEVELGLNGEFEGGQLIVVDLQFAADVVRAVALGEQ